MQMQSGYCYDSRSSGGVQMHDLGLRIPQEDGTTTKMGALESKGHMEAYGSQCGPIYEL